MGSIAPCCNQDFKNAWRDRQFLTKLCRYSHIRLQSTRWLHHEAGCRLLDTKRGFQQSRQFAICCGKLHSGRGTSLHCISITAQCTSPKSGLTMAAKVQRGMHDWNIVHNGNSSTCVYFTPVKKKTLQVNPSSLLSWTQTFLEVPLGDSPNSVHPGLNTDVKAFNAGLRELQRSVMLFPIS